jgi:hypothetical protein
MQGRSGEHCEDERVDRTRHAGCLRELALWALAAVPAMGALSPAGDSAYRAIASAAGRWLQAAAAARAVRSAAETVRRAGADPADLLDAARWQQSVGEEAYYYAGPACGLTLAAIAERESQPPRDDGGATKRVATRSARLPIGIAGCSSATGADGRPPPYWPCWRRPSIDSVTCTKLGKLPAGRVFGLDGC